MSDRVGEGQAGKDEHEMLAGMPSARCVKCDYPAGWIWGRARTCSEYRQFLKDAKGALHAD